MDIIKKIMSILPSKIFFIIYFIKLSENLPSTHKTISSLICRISGEVMDEHNPPLMLPNG